MAEQTMTKEQCCLTAACFTLTVLLHSHASLVVFLSATSLNVE